MGMHVTKEGMFILSFVILAVTALICSQLGVGTTYDLESELVPVSGGIGFITNGIGWLANCLTFQFVENYGVIVSFVVWILSAISVLSFALIVMEVVDALIP